MTRYLARKIGIYLLTFFVAVTIDWAIPRLHAGQPDAAADLADAGPARRASQALTGYYTKAFGLDVPLWKQYLELLGGALPRRSRAEHLAYPAAVSTLIWARCRTRSRCSCRRSCSATSPATRSARWPPAARSSTTRVLPFAYVLTATPYMWLAIVLAWLLALSWPSSPSPARTTSRLQPAWSLEFARSFLSHWFLPFLTLFLVSFGGWAIGMRNLIIYELEADYSQLPRSRSARRPSSCASTPTGTRVLPQMSGLALALGAVVGGALVTEIVFGYPGLGTLIITALQNRDYFLMQGIFLFIIVGRPDRELHRRHRLRDRRPAHARRDPGVADGGGDHGSTRGPLAGRESRPTAAAPRGTRHRRPGRSGPESSTSRFRNTKLVVGLTVVCCSCWRSSARGSPTRDPFEFGFPLGEPPSSAYWLGTTSAGQDVFAQFVYGLRASFIVGAVAGGVAAVLGMAIGFIGGYRGGIIDDILSMLTNIVLVIPTLAVLIIVAAYLSVGSLMSEAVLIGLTSWPWAARAIRAQTFSLAARDFVNLARLSGRRLVRSHRATRSRRT